MASTWFTEREVDLVTAVVETICGRMDMEPEDLLGSINLPYSHPLERMMEKHFKYDPCKCHVRVKDGQCTRQISSNHTMCGTHAKMREKGTLPEEMVIRMSVDDALERYRTIKKDSRWSRLQLYVWKEEDYLYDPLTAYVYDFDSLKRIGKMHSSGKIFFE